MVSEHVRTRCSGRLPRGGPLGGLREGLRESFRSQPQMRRAREASVRPPFASIFCAGGRSEAATEVVMPVEHLMKLRCHPSSRAPQVRDIQVLVRRSSNDELQMKYCLNGDIPQLRIPSAGAPRIGTQLWQHTCFEAFIAVEGQSAYHEFNFAPSGEWAVYAFVGYRERGPQVSEIMPPRIAVRSTQSRFELDTLVHLDGLSGVHRRASLRLGLSAVIEASDRLSYWALRHPTGKPDFHHADGFALLLKPPGPE
jgi:hypothetical protein